LPRPVERLPRPVLRGCGRHRGLRAAAGRGRAAERMIRDLDPPVHAVREVVARALAEDFGMLGDLTSIAVIDEGATATGRFVARGEGVLAGTASASEVFTQLQSAVRLEWLLADGDDLEEGQVIGEVDGSLRSILGAERTALNLLQHLSGIATL